MTRAEALQLYENVSEVAGNTTSIPETVKRDIRRLYSYCTGETLRRCNCPDTYSDALIIIKLKLRKMEKENKYTLKRGVVIQVPGTTDVYTRDNITDEVAKAYLSKYPNKEKLFENIPAETEPEEKAEEAPADPKEKKEKKTKK